MRFRPRLWGQLSQRHRPRFPVPRRHWPRHRLYLQIFFGFLKVLLVLGLLIGGLFWHFAGNRAQVADAHVSTLLQTLFPVTASPAETESVMRAINGISGGSVALYAPDGRLLQAVGPAAPTLDQAIRPHESDSPFHPAVLPDGRRLNLEWNQDGQTKHFGWIVLFLLLAALGAYPISRRLTRRIEALQVQADAWGEGNLSVRAKVDGCDEIAELATRFNQAAERIESLLGSQRAMLAAASHELRSPLARIRMASDLIGEDRPDLQTQIARDIAELDTLIGDLLLASRLSNDSPQMKLEQVDLLGLAAEEAARAGAELDGQPICLFADARLLRHMLRNLLENARRHAAGTPINVLVEATEDDGALVRVLDRGPGVPECEREKVFEPFYRPAGTVESGDGVGYGLALVRRIARLHGGDVSCSEREGGGACFEVRLAVCRT